MAAGKIFGFKNTSREHMRSSIQSSLEISGGAVLKNILLGLWSYKKGVRAHCAVQITIRIHTIAVSIYKSFLKVLCINYGNEA